MSALRSAGIPDTPLDRVLTRLDHVRRSGAGWSARCPAHDDRNNSLSVNEGDDGRALVYCHAGCTIDDIVGAIDLTLGDLFEPSGPSFVPGPVPAPVVPERRKIVAEYRYCNADGEVVFETVRFEPKDFRQRRPDGRGGWAWNLDGVTRIPYRLPELLRADPKAPVYIVEGEKDADALTARGLVATCNVGGIGKWHREYSEALRERQVVILPDNDDPGRRHAQDVARSLAGVAAVVRIIELPDLRPKGDVSDWLAAGGDAAKLADLAAAESPWSPAADGAAWVPPLPLDEPALPPFPLDTLPPVLREFVGALAIATQTPPDLAALLALAAVATAVARKAVVLVRSGWEEPLNIYVAVVLPSGNRKSAVFRAVIAPLDAWACTVLASAATETEMARSRRKIKEAELRKAEKEAAEAKDAMERDAAMARAEHHARDLAAMPEPVAPQLIADDATPETVKTLLYEQGGRLALLSPEGTVFELMAGRYSKNGAPNLEVYLNGHAGDTIRVNRRGRTELVHDPALTIGLAVQPNVLRAFADHPAFRGRGLTARFLYALPPSLVGRRETAPPPVPDAVRNAYAAMLTALLDLPLGPVPPQLHLNGHAAERFHAFERDTEPQLAEFGRLGDLADWGSKLPGAVARLAGLLHLATNAERPAPWDLPIDGPTMEAAIRLGQYFIPHALAAGAAMGADAVVEDASHVLRWIIKEGRATIKKQEVWQGTRGRLERVERLDKALALLIAHGYLREQQAAARGGAGRRPAPDYEVNPYIATYNPYNPYNSPAAPPPDNSRDSRDCREQSEGAATPEEWGDDWGIA